MPVKVYDCNRCGHQWAGRGGKKPKCCPKCHSPYWNTPRKYKLAIA